MKLVRGMVCLLVIGLAVSTLPLMAAADEVDEETRNKLIYAVKGEIRKLTDSKNSDGKRNKRADYSRVFTPLEDGKYLASVNINTAEDNTQVTERYQLTLAPKGDEFEVVASEAQDHNELLHRDSGFACYPFESFNFNREGMTLSASNGGVCEVFFEGDVSRFVLMGSKLSYDYQIPEHVNYLQQGHDFFPLRQMLGRDHADIIEFTPELFAFDCDPESCEELLDSSFTGLTRRPKDQRGHDDDASDVRVYDPLDKWIDRAVKEARDARKENPFAGFHRAPDPGNDYYIVSVHKNEDHAIGIRYDNWEGYEVTFWVNHDLNDPEAPRGALFGYYTEETLKNTSFYDLERRDDQGARWYDVYKLNADVTAGVDDPEMVSAQVDFGLNIKHDIDVLPFFIANSPAGDGDDYKRASLFVNSIRMGDQELTWVKTSAFGGIVVLPQVAKAGAKIELSMSFDTKAIRKFNTAYSQLARFGWMPFVRFGDFVEEFEMTIRTPSEYKVLGVGHMTSERTEGNVLITNWVADSPVVFPSVIFGKYYSDKPRFPAKKADGREIPVEVHVDTVSMMQLTDQVTSFDDVENFQEEMRSGARGIRSSQLRSIAEQAANSINLYTEISGIEYPYGALNLVNDPAPAMYGQAPSSLIYLGSLVFRGEGAMAGDGGIMGGGGTGTAKFLKSVVAHEVGHQWWGSRVSNANQRNYWFVETLAEYFSALYLEAVFGRKEYDEQVEEWRRNVLNNDLKTSVQAADSLWPGEGGGRARQSLIYNKGPYAFHILRQTFGDEKFFPFIKKFTMELAEKREIVTRDIQLAAEKHLGGVDENGNPYNVDLEWFFDQWIRGVGLPQFTLDYTVTRTEDGSYLIEGNVKQEIVVGSKRRTIAVAGKAAYRGVIDLTVKGRKKGEEFQRQLVVNGENTTFKVKVPVKPVEVAINGTGGMLSHDTINR